jgi:hypothetical protein
MSMKEREKVLLARFRKAGLKPNQVQVEAPFKFVVSPTTTSGVDTKESGFLAREFGNRIVENIREWTMQSPITGIVVFPKILDANIAKMPDHLTYKRKERSVFVGVNIPFEAWVTSPFAEKVEILSETILEALGRIAPRQLYPEDRDRLARAINAVRETVKLNHVTQTNGGEDNAEQV